MIGDCLLEWHDDKEDGGEGSCYPPKIIFIYEQPLGTKESSRIVNQGSVFKALSTRILTAVTVSPGTSHIQSIRVVKPWVSSHSSFHSFSTLRESLPRSSHVFISPSSTKVSPHAFSSGLMSIKWIGVLQDTARVPQSPTNQYQGTNETPLSCWKHWPVRLQLVAKHENVQFWPQNLDIWGQK